MRSSAPTRIALCLPLVLLLCGCGSESKQNAPTVARATEKAPNMILRGLWEPPPAADEPGGGRLADWPNEGSRWRLQLAREDVLTFERGSVELADPPPAIDALRFGADWIIVRVGPVGEWYENQTLFFLLRAATHEVHAVGSYLYNDLGGGAWETIHGTVRTDPALGPQSKRVRCAYSLMSEDEKEAGALQGSFEISLESNAEALQRELVSFGVEFTTGE